MHSRRMRTGRSLTVCWRLLPGGGGSAPWGVCLVLGGLLLGGCVWSGESLSGPPGVCSGGWCLLWGGLVRGVCVCSGGIWSGGVCICSWGVVSQHALRQTPPWRESQMPVKTLPWPNFFAAGKNPSILLIFKKILAKIGLAVIPSFPRPPPPKKSPMCRHSHLAQSF